MTASYSHIAQNTADVRGRIERACARAGRDPSSVTLVAVSKTFPTGAVAAAVAAGALHMGENRVQEAMAKRAACDSAGVSAAWHLIGHLQTNKIRDALATFDILHSIDSERLAGAISRQAQSPIDVLVEVNVAGEASKSGFSAEDVLPALERIARLPGLNVRGLMTVAPAVHDPDQVRPVFCRLRELRDAAGLAELSMGMTGDFEVAIEEGATLVRVGRALFGERA